MEDFEGTVFITIKKYQCPSLCLCVDEHGSVYLDEFNYDSSSFWIQKSYDDEKYIIGVITNSGRRIFVTKETDKSSKIPSRIETFSQEIDDVIHTDIKTTLFKLL